MKTNIYMFMYSTKTRSLKCISYCACSFSSATKKFRKNTRWTELFDIQKIC